MSSHNTFNMLEVECFTLDAGYTHFLSLLARRSGRRFLPAATKHITTRYDVKNSGCDCSCSCTTTIHAAALHALRTTIVILKMTRSVRLDN